MPPFAMFLLIFFLVLSLSGTTSSSPLKTADTTENGIDHHASPDNEIPPSRPSTGWTRTSYPNPTTTGSVQCRTSQSNPRICDPDSVLTASEIELVASKMMSFSRSHSIWCEELQKEGGDSDGVPVEVAMALMKRIDGTSHRQPVMTEERHADSAKRLGMGLHDDWGVGSSSCGGTGVLVILSVEDRSLFISTGGAIRPYVTEERLDKIISGMKRHLKREEYCDALLQALDDIFMFIEKGELTPREAWADFFRENIGAAMMVMYVLFAILKKMYTHFILKGAQREYAAVRSQLTRMDRDRALVLRGNYQCTSCPICLEDFSSDREEPDGDGDDGNETVGTSRLPTKGSDNRPIKLLRCGHVFDETCWQGWIEGGSGNVHKCPVCNQDVGGAASTDTRPIVRDIRHDGGGGHAVLRQRGDRQNLIARYERERNFRLMRLLARYPRYIQRTQVQRWTREGYDGSLVRDDAFLKNDPSRRVIHNADRSRMRSPSAMSGGFGGGRSSGGSGGTW